MLRTKKEFEEMQSQFQRDLNDLGMTSHFFFASL